MGKCTKPGYFNLVTSGIDFIFYCDGNCRNRIYWVEINGKQHNVQSQYTHEDLKKGHKISPMSEEELTLKILGVK